MKQQTRGRWAVIAAVAMSVGLGMYTASRATAVAPAPAPAPPAAPKVATVELESVIQKLKEREDKEKALAEEQKRLQDRLDGMQKEADALKTKLENEPDGPNKIAMAKEFREKIYRIDFEANYSKKLLGEMKGEMLSDMFKRIEEATRTLAKQNGYDLVITSDEKASVRQGDPESVLRAIALKRILYVNPALDITQEVVDYLNNQYAAGAKATKP